MSWFDVIQSARPYSGQVSLVIPALTAVLAARIAYSARRPGKTAGQKRLGMFAALGTVISGFMFFRHDWGLLSFFVLFGFLTMGVAASLDGVRRRLALLPATGMIALGLTGILSGYSIMLSLGPSMWPTAPKGFSVALMDFDAYKGSRPALGHDVNFTSPGTEGWPTGSYRKRVWGLPGDHVVIDGDVIEVNGKPVADCRKRQPRLAANIWLCPALVRGDLHEVVWGQENGQWFGRLETYVPAGHVFVMGDNTVESSDSRERGPIPLSWIAGRYVSIPVQNKDWAPWTL